jgi:hypothetical protein
MWNGFEDVDARNKCGHDESEIVAVGLSLGRAVKNPLERQRHLFILRTRFHGIA